MKDINLALGIKADATEAEATAAIQKKNVDFNALKTSELALKKKNEQLESQVETLTAQRDEVIEATAKAEVKAAAAAGKIKDDQESIDKAEAYARKDLQGFRSMIEMVPDKPGAAKKKKRAQANSPDPRTRK